MADISNPNDPATKVESTVDDQSAPQKDDNKLQSGLGTTVKGPGSPSTKGKTEEERKESRERLKTAFIILAFSVSCLALGLSYLSYSVSKRSAIAAERSATAAENSAINSGKTADAAKESAGNSRRSADLTEQALTKVQRAFVHIKNMEAHSARDTQGNVASWVFQGQWENSGATNTQDFRQYSNYAWGIHPMPDNYDFPDMGTGSSIDTLIAAKDVLSTSPMPVPPDVLRDVQEGKRYLYFWGWAAYRDVFQNSSTHLTEYCFQVAGIEGDVMRSGVVRFIYFHCPLHNCADESCKDYDQAEKKLKKN